MGADLEILFLLQRRFLALYIDRALHSKYQHEEQKALKPHRSAWTSCSMVGHSYSRIIHSSQRCQYYKQRLGRHSTLSKLIDPA